MLLSQLPRSRSRSRAAAAACFALAAAGAFLLCASSSSSLDARRPDGGGDDERNVFRTTTRRASSAAVGVANETMGGLRVLALGGSVTWGATLKDGKRDAYPYVIGRDPSVARVDNLAVRATGSAYFASCLQSMLRSERRTNSAKEEAAADDDAVGGKHVNENVLNDENVLNENYWDDVDYDVIIVEFNVNGKSGLPLLLTRLQRRYPDALIVYVELFRCNDRELRWKPKRGARRWDHIVPPALNIPAPAYLYDFPRPTDVDDEDSVNKFRATYYAEDAIHLNEAGHSKVAENVLAFLLSATEALPPRRRPPRRGTWGGGDQCLTWFSTGRVPAPKEGEGGGGVEFVGGKMVEFSEGKFAYEVPHALAPTLSASASASTSAPAENTNGRGEEEEVAATIVLHNTGSTPAPIYLNYMTRGNPCEYPKVEVTIRSAGTLLEHGNAAKLALSAWEEELATATSSTAEDDAGASTASSLPNLVVVVDPLNIVYGQILGDVHVTRGSFAGHAPLFGREEQRTALTIRAVERTALPFRIVGFTMCAACEEMKNVGAGYGGETQLSPVRGGYVKEAGASLSQETGLTPI